MEVNILNSSESLSVLETRLESLTPFNETNGYVFFVSEEKKNLEGLNEEELKITNRIADLMNLKKDVLVKQLTEGFYTVKIAKKDDLQDKTINQEIYQTIIDLDVTGKTSVTNVNEFEYRGSLNWHQLVQKMLRKGFEQDPEFDKLAGSNSYESKEEIATEMNDDSSDKKESTDSITNTNEVRTFDKETNLVIVGTGDDSSDLQITDDYSGYDVYIGGKHHKFPTEPLDSMSCDGFVTIMEVDEYKKWLENFDNDGGSFDAIDCLFVPNFKGTIGVVAKSERGEFSTDFELSDYICHQFEYYVEVGLVFPEGTKIIQMKDGQIPLDVIRDLKIDNILQ